MKKKQLQIYSGKKSELSKPATPEQIALGISNALEHAEPFLMTDATEIGGLTEYCILNAPTERFMIGGSEMFTVDEFKEFGKHTIGAEIISSATTAYTSNSPTLQQSKFLWGSNTNNLNFTLSPALGSATTETNFLTHRTITIVNTTPASAGATTHGYINVIYDGVTIDIIPRNTGRTYVYGKHYNSTTTSTLPLLDRNLYTQVESFTTASNYVLDPSVALVYALNYDISTPSTITVQTTNLSMSFDTFTVLMKNTNGTNKLTLTVPTGDFASARTYEINAGKYREASIVRRNGNIIWQVSEELSNA